MLIIETQRNSPDNRFVVRSKEPGTGIRGWKVKDLTIEEAQLAVSHYFTGHKEAEVESARERCALCRRAS